MQDNLLLVGPKKGNWNCQDRAILFCGGGGGEGGSGGGGRGAGGRRRESIIHKINLVLKNKAGGEGA